MPVFSIFPIINSDLKFPSALSINPFTIEHYSVFTQNYELLRLNYPLYDEKSLIIKLLGLFLSHLVSFLGPPTTE